MMGLVSWLSRRKPCRGSEAATGVPARAGGRTFSGSLVCVGAGATAVSVTLARATVGVGCGGSVGRGVRRLAGFNETGVAVAGGGGAGVQADATQTITRTKTARRIGTAD